METWTLAMFSCCHVNQHCTLKPDSTALLCKLLTLVVMNYLDQCWFDGEVATKL
jgi:hypothetical protein